mgnify:CR=1 FL=1|tara:strand:+ start:4754 stop:6259 length:1506 start_codon:yes stop_codon:yes gene_type:complete
MSLLQEYLSKNAKHVTGLEVSSEDYIAPEDVEVPEVADVDDAELYEAEDQLEEAEQERLEREYHEKEVVSTIQEAEAIHTSIENYMEVLGLGIESGEFSPQFAAIAGTDLKRFNQILGGTEDAVPAFESYDHDSLEQFYTESLEGFKEVAGKLVETVKSVSKGAVDYVGMIGTNEKAASAINTKADALLGKLSSSEISDGEIALKNLGRVFSVEGKVPQNLIQAVNADQKGFQTLASNHFKNSVSYYEDAVKAGSDALKKPGEAGAVIEAFAKKPTPNEQIAKSVKLLGCEVSTFDSGADLPKNTNRAVADALSERLGEQVIMFDAYKKADGSVKLDKTQVTALLKAAKGYAAIMATLNKEAKKELERQVKIDKELQKALSNNAPSKTGSVTGASLAGGLGGAWGGGLTFGPVGAVVGGVGGATAMGKAVAARNASINKNAGTDMEQAIREMGAVIKNASGIPLAHFKEMGKVIEFHAKSCMELAERAMTAKKKEAETSGE